MRLITVGESQRYGQRFIEISCPAVSLAVDLAMSLVRMGYCVMHRETDIIVQPDDAPPRLKWDFFAAAVFADVEKANERIEAENERERRYAELHMPPQVSGIGGVVRGFPED